MGALPKNKITRVERGKRRRGNTPALRRDSNTSIPQHKRGFVTQMLQFLGISNQSQPSTSTSASPKPELKPAASASTAAKTSATTPNSSPAGSSARRTSPAASRSKSTTVKSTRKTQHKG